MSAVPIQPEITPVDRLGLTLCLALIIHAIIALGVTFTQEDKYKPRYNSMDIILVQQKDKTIPEDAKVLAQASLEGGGDVAEELIPATPVPPPFPDNQAEIASQPQAKPAPAEPLTEAMQKPRPEIKKSEAQPVEEIAVKSPTPETAVNKPEKKAEEDSKPKKQQPSATALLTNSFKIAALSSEIKRKLEAKAKRPKRKFISASTREYKYAAYMEAWRAKVERVGNLNYPEYARKKKISGSLILDVALNPNGTVNQITIRRSSGHKVLDDAAIRIVELAAPFSPFPDSIKSETDILHITRTWQFINNKGFR